MNRNEAQAKELNMMRDAYRRRSYIPELAEKIGDTTLRVLHRKKPTLLQRIIRRMI